jgi:anti-sigma regulatory factor (Ser/Thr protein kinase)
MSSDLISHISEARRFFSELISWFSKDEKITEDMMTIFDEALSNALRHAYPEGKQDIVKITLYIDDRKGKRYFVLTVFDRGKMPEGIPTNLKDYHLNIYEYLQKTNKIGGMGLSIISRLADKAYWKKVKGGKYFVAIKRFK